MTTPKPISIKTPQKHNTDEVRLPMVADQRKDADWAPDIICDRCVAKDHLVNSQMDIGARGSYLLHRNERA
jgi:hypothetical protein